MAGKVFFYLLVVNVICTNVKKTNGRRIGFLGEKKKIKEKRRKKE